MAAELQAITFREYLPALLGGTDHIPPYQRYNEGVNVGMSNIMATAAFRFVIHTSYAAITIEYLTTESLVFSRYRQAFKPEFTPRTDTNDTL